MKKKIKETNETRIILDKIANLTLLASNYFYSQSQKPINKGIIASHIDFVNQIMNMCTDYATQLIPETDTLCSVSRIKAALDILSDYLTVYLLTKELEKQVNAVINICYDYLEQIELEPLSCDKGRGRDE